MRPCTSTWAWWPLLRPADQGEAALAFELEFHLPGALGPKPQPFGPFHRQQGPQGGGLLLLLGKQVSGGGGQLKPVEVQVHQGG